MNPASMPDFFQKKLKGFRKVPKIKLGRKGKNPAGSNHTFLAHSIVVILSNL
jgi:hypothetical protein